MKQIFIGNFLNDNDVFTSFDVKDINGINILFASYQFIDSYNGEAFVLFERDGKYYEVNGNHCSCYGLEGQWISEEITVEVLKYRLTEGKLGVDYYGNNEFKDELLEYIEENLK